jgi:hypothetical protein
VARVVDPGDDQAMVALLDHGDGRILDLERKQAAARPADHSMQCDLYDAPVRNHDDVAVTVALEDRVDRSEDACLEEGGSLASRHQVPIGLLVPARPRCRKAFGQLLGAQALPITEKDLTEPGHRLGDQPGRRLDRLRRLERTLQVARVKACEPTSGEAPANPLGLMVSFFGERRIELPLDAVLAVPGRLAVANEQQPRGRRPGSKR